MRRGKMHAELVQLFSSVSDTFKFIEINHVRFFSMRESFMPRTSIVLVIYWILILILMLRSHAGSAKWSQLMKDVTAWAYEIDRLLRGINHYGTRRGR